MTTPGPDQDEAARGETAFKPSAPPRPQGVQFTPGTIIAGRYRISGILGSGLFIDVPKQVERLDAHVGSVQAAPELRSAIPSLRDWYGRLSDDLHAARADESLFTKALDSINKHLDIRRAVEF